MPDPIQVQCASACTVTVEHVITIPPFNLSMADAGQIALSIISVWALAWGIRQVIVFLRQSGATPTEEREP